MTHALVSVVTPCWNAGPFVADTIAAVAAQTYPAVEHIVVDDGSSDGSWDVIQRHAGQVIALRLERNGGGARARNLAAARAQGAYLMFLDADDVLEPGAVAALVKAVEDRPLGIGVCAWGRLRHRDSEWTREPAEIPFPPPPDPLLGWLQGTWVPPCAVLWRRDAYDLAGGWDEALVVNQDGELVMRALARGAQIAVAAGEPLAWYRAHGDARTSVSAGVVTQRWLSSQARVLDRVAAELGPRASTAPYGPALGAAYAYFGRLALVHDWAELAGTCLRRSEHHWGAGATPRTLAGRALRAVLGVEGKERVAMALAGMGFGSATRRRFVARERAGSPSGAWAATARAEEGS